MEPGGFPQTGRWLVEEPREIVAVFVSGQEYNAGVGTGSLQEPLLFPQVGRRHHCQYIESFGVEKG